MVGQGAGIFVVTIGPGKRFIQAPVFTVAGIPRTTVPILAGNFIRTAVAVVVVSVACFCNWLQRVAGGQALLDASALAFASSKTVGFGTNGGGPQKNRGLRAWTFTACKNALITTGITGFKAIVPFRTLFFGIARTSAEASVRAILQTAVFALS
jgi:hypothetical protein